MCPDTDPQNPFESSSVHYYLVIVIYLKQIRVSGEYERTQHAQNKELGIIYRDKITFHLCRCDQ